MLLKLAKETIKKINQPFYDLKEGVLGSLLFYEEGIDRHFDITITLQFLFECLVYYGICLGMDKQEAIKKAYGFFKLAKNFEKQRIKEAQFKKEEN